MKEQILKAEELVDGNYYIGISTENRNYIFKCQHPNQNIRYLRITPADNPYYGLNGNIDTRSNNAFKHYILPSPEQIRHFMECARFDRYVKPKQKSLYNLI